MAVKNEDGYSSDGSASDWNPDSPAENSSDEEKVCNMIVTNSFEGNSSDPNSDSEIEHEENSDTESDGEKGKMWYCQALKVWRSGKLPKEEDERDASSPMVNQWRNQNEGIDSSSSSDESQEDLFDEPAFYNCQKNDCPGSPGVQGCTPTACQLDPIEVEQNYSDSGSEMEANVDLWCSMTTDESFNLTLDDTEEHNNEQAHMAIEQTHSHVVASIPKKSTTWIIWILKLKLMTV